MKQLLVLIYFVFIQGCLDTNTTPSNIRISETGSDKPDVFCKYFSLKNEEVREFFSKSREVEIKEIHDNYQYLPCYVKGTLAKGNAQCNFEIRAGGTAELLCNDNTGYLYVCDNCDHLLTN